MLPRSPRRALDLLAGLGPAASSSLAVAKRMSSARSTPSNPVENAGDMRATLDLAASSPLLVVPLPRRPLFPNYCTAAYLRNLPGLMRTLRDGDRKFVAAFMVKGNTDYRGCILRPGLAGKELLQRLHPVGTLAEVRTPPEEETGRVVLLGRRRVRITGRVAGDGPLAVRVEPLEEQGLPFVDKVARPGLSQEERLSEARAGFEPLRRALLLIQELSGQSFFEPGSQTMWYFNAWEKNMGPLVDFGPAVLPVLDKSEHQRALEELDSSRRLELTIRMIKRELEMDRTNGWWDAGEAGHSAAEKQALAELWRPGQTQKGFDLPLFKSGEMLLSPSLHLRATLNMYHDHMRPDNLRDVKGFLRHTRVSEHLVGY